MTKDLVRDDAFYKLLEDVQSNGVVNPLEVKHIGDDYYEVIDGNKRLACAFSLGLESLPCHLVE